MAEQFIFKNLADKGKEIQAYIGSLERAKQGQGFKATYDWIKLAQSWEQMADSTEDQRYMPVTDKLRTWPI